MAHAVPYIIMAVASATSAIASGQAQKKQANMQAALAQNQANADFANAKIAQVDAERQADALKAERRRALASGNVAAGASGIELTGSFNDSQFDTAMAYERDIATTVYKGQIEGFNYRNSAGNRMYEGRMYRSAGRAAVTNSYFQAASSVASAFAGYKGSK